MMAESQEKVMGCKDYMQIMKGKRAKRRRPQFPLTSATVSSCSSGAESEGEVERFSDNSVEIGGHDLAVAGSGSGAGSLATSVEEFATSTEEEEDMANCLILLAQGRQHTKKLSADHQPIATTSKPVALGLYAYECKTCNRCFPSFQALGGHRAGHKKPKVSNINNEEKKAVVVMEEDDVHFGDTSTTLSLQIANRVANLSANTTTTTRKANKVHECSICGAEFSSGQALGGHMRRHRAFMSTTTTTTTPTTAFSNCVDQDRKKPRNILQLDLNLPAPEDHHRHEPKFNFASKEQVIVFSTSSLVDCHY